MSTTNPRNVPQVHDLILSFPKPNVFLVTLNRPSRLNAIPPWQHQELDKVFKWYDQEPSLRCAVLTGTGRAFCAGADLKDWNDRAAVPGAVTPPRWETTGFGGISNRVGKKPVIAAVNGICAGGGMEMVVNCDLVVAAEEAATFSLPEVKRGVVALAGVLPRLMRSLGKQRASEMALLGRTYGARELKDWGIVNFVVKDTELLTEALNLAEEVANNSPDSVIVSREGLRLGWENMGPVQATEELGNGLYKKMDGESNMKEGLLSFVEKRRPRWKDSKL
ncbi:hypothetical protein CEP52_009513 [Fusarium oligoseptatum]|uniref:Enoyl-CoA hydratase n=1 Tax=Fusarium oligoseptatum TaxID=2604345 RepID=A0A428TCT1_9HYPO|nr:hypothetical protein CEP52_009513 [Fusarium oligoseptatum]